MNRMTAFRRWRTVDRVRRAANRYRPDRDETGDAFPSVIQVQTINACNASCTMCPYGTTADSTAGGRMDEALWDRIVDEIAQHDEVDTFIPMLQNEPFLDRDILQKVSEFKKRSRGRVKVELVTHGGLLTPETVEEIRRSRLDVLSISVDSVRPETYRRIRVGLDYDRVMSNIDHLLAARLDTQVFIRMVRQSANQEEVDEFAHFWKARGVDAVVWEVENRAGSVPDFESLRATSRGRWQTLVSDRLMRRFLRHCPIPFQAGYILHNGDLIVCAFDWLHESVVGNVRDQAIVELWNSETMRRYRRLHYERRAGELAMCRRCSMWQRTWAAKEEG